ncbi:MAG: quinone-dependent dihydroorotate dehydrogenase [Chloroflexi bacterium]|nr:quinone-dependent dihydroorotate dehydrogenase [Chloroflexota bacterium]
MSSAIASLLGRLLGLIPPFPWYRRLVRPLLFRLPPEAAQQLAERALGVRSFWRLAASLHADGAAHTTMAGIPLRNPVGLAAGFDKQCALLDPLGDLGFGYVVGGTVTFDARPGNPRPRLMRLPERESLINALGFPSDGLDAVARRLRALRRRPAVVLVSIAALDETETERCMEVLEPLVDGIELNISSPNTQGLRRFQEPDNLRALLERLNARRSKPLFVKLPPYADEPERENVLSLLRVCAEVGVSGVTAINTVPTDEPRMATGRGGISGAAILPDMLRIIPELRREAGGGMTINACGGIASAADAAAALDAGADTVQLYTALVYRGPGVVREITAGLASRELLGTKSKRTETGSR